MNITDENLDWFSIVFAIIYVFALVVIFYNIGKDAGKESQKFLCPPVQQGQELLSSAILMDDDEKPIALTCSYMEPHKNKGRAITRKTSKL